MRITSNPRKRLAALPVVLALSVVLTACGSDDPVSVARRVSGEQPVSPAARQVAGTLTGIGSSSQKSAVDAWIAEFEELQPDANVQYSGDGSGAGRTALIAGAAQFAGTDAFLKDEELEQSLQKCGPGGALDIPVYISPIEVAYNLEGIDHLNLDAPTIARIFTGKVTRWDDAAITAQNPGVQLPDLAITAVHRGDESGTTQNFTDYLHQAAPEEWPDKPAQKWPANYGGEAAQKTAGVVQTAEGTPGAVTYADESGISPKLGRTHLKVGEKYVGVSSEGAAAVVAGSPKAKDRPEGDLALKLDRTPDAGTAPNAYPLVLVSYQAFCTTYQDEATADLVRTWLRYVVSEEGQETAEKATGSAPLTPELRAEAERTIDRIAAGGK